MSTQVELHLIPAPGAKPEFLALVESPLTDLPPKIVLEGYTRDEWAAKPAKELFKTVIVKSVDGRKKLPGFLKYLKERQKTAYGRFKNTNGNDSGYSAVWVIGPTQPPSKENEAYPRMLCRYTLQLGNIPNCPLVKPKQQQQQQRVPAKAKQLLPNNKRQAPGNNKPNKAGLLGNLLGAARRTNEQVMAVVPMPKQTVTATTTEESSAQNGDSDKGGSNDNTKTGQEVIAKFREKMEQEMLDFDICDETLLKVPVSLSKMSEGLSGVEKTKVTMEILKYIVYEQAEEINEEWVAAKEPSEFMDESVICVYKEGHAPVEVLEDLNKGDLPDEIRGQQRAMQAETQRRTEQKEAKLQKQRMSRAHHEADNADLALLNTEKRDRRTIEEIQREMLGGEGEDNSKKPRLS